jgi:hypothetical protein
MGIINWLRGKQPITPAQSGLTPPSKPAQPNQTTSSEKEIFQSPALLAGWVNRRNRGQTTVSTFC